MCKLTTSAFLRIKYFNVIMTIKKIMKHFQKLLFDEKLNYIYHSATKRQFIMIFVQIIIVNQKLLLEVTC